ncbi:MAG: hypothetical protein J5699_01760 [Bacteroidales bacterium]|nr:hypothetical protein [Bacteroidales bacterium]
MKRIGHLFFAALAALALISCEATGPDGTGRYWNADNQVFTAAFEETRVFLDSDLHTCWNAEDRISVFTSDVNEQYIFDGQTGDVSGTFKKSPQDPTTPGDPLSANYAIYPYRATNAVLGEGSLAVEMPSLQQYGQNTFGPGANTMVAMTSGPADNSLFFRNLCGVLVVKLYGTGKVLSITFEGNAGEKIAGKSVVTAAHGAAPILSFAEDATSSITVDCGSGVTIGTDAENATEFWFVIPPTEFKSGFTVSALGINGKHAVLTTSASRTIERNVVIPMYPAEARFEVQEGLVEFDDTAFKSYCVKQFDRNHDGEISYAEASWVDTLKVGRKSIASMKGLEAFINLTYLDCSQNRLTALNVSKCTKLVTLICNGNLISELSLSSNIDLKVLRCGSNQLSSLSLIKNTELTEVSCDINQLASLDVALCKSLKTLECRYNKLTSLNLLGNTELSTLRCNNNEIASLSLPLYGSLKDLYCGDNMLSSLDLGTAPNVVNLYCSNNKLTYLRSGASVSTLDCSNNLLSSMDLSNSTRLMILYCGSNLFTTLDLSLFGSLRSVSCSNCPNLTTIYLKTGQTVSVTSDPGVNIVYK